MYRCVCLHVYVCMYRCVCTYVYLYRRVCRCVYVFVYVCVKDDERKWSYSKKKIATLSFYILREFKMALKLEQSGLHLKVFNLITFAYSAFSLFGKSGYRIHQEKKHSLHETFAERMKTKL